MNNKLLYLLPILLLISLFSVSAIVNNSLIGYYSFDNNNITFKGKDFIGTNNLTPVGTTSLLLNVTGLKSYAYYLANAGGDSYYSNTNLNYNLGSIGEYTMNFWFNDSQNLNSDTLFYYSDGSSTFAFYKLLGYYYLNYNGVPLANNTPITNINKWVMASFIYNSDTNILKFYLDSDLKNTVSINFNNTFNDILFGRGKGVTYDELAVFNSSLSELDLLYLYNNGLGRNLSDITSNYVNYYEDLVCNNDQSLCYKDNAVCFPNNEFYPGINSSNYLCNSVNVIDNYLYCSDDLVYCVGGCTNYELQNVYNVSYTAGNCILNTTDCSNDCNVEGLTYSDTITSYKECGFYDSDVCLDWSTSIPCNDGQYSYDGICTDLNSTYNAYYTKRSFNMIPELIFAKDYSTTGLLPYINLLNVDSNFIDVGIDYTSSTSSFYINQNCDYKESLLFSDNTVYTDNNSFTFNNYNSGYLSFNLVFGDDDTVADVYGYNLNDELIFNYTIQNNISYGVCVYDNNGGGLIGCEVSPGTSLKSIDFTIQTMSDGQYNTVSSRTIINGNNNGFSDIYTSFRGTSIDSTLYKVDIIDTNHDNMNITSIRVYNIDNTYNTFINRTWLYYTTDSNSAISSLLSNTNYQDYGISYTDWYNYNYDKYNFYLLKNPNIINIPVYTDTCIFNENRCYNVRSYFANNLDETGYWNYKDYKICTGSLSGTGFIQDGDNSFSGMSDRNKLFTALISILFIFIVAFGVGIYFNQITLFSWIGTFLSVGLAGYFAIIGWLPVWLIIVMFLISAFVVMIFFRNMFLGNSNN